MVRIRRYLQAVGLLGGIVPTGPLRCEFIRNAVVRAHRERRRPPTDDAAGSILFHFALSGASPHQQSTASAARALRNRVSEAQAALSLSSAQKKALERGVLYLSNSQGIHY
jgi:hypothetical protein